MLRSLSLDQAITVSRVRELSQQVRERTSEVGEEDVG